MFDYLSYYHQSKDLSLPGKSTQHFLLLSDMTHAFRDIGKFGTIAGTVSSAAGAILGYNPKPLVKITAAGALTWFCCHHLFKTLEPQALSILESYHRNQKTLPVKSNVLITHTATFENWFKEELDLLHQNMLENKIRWIVVDSRILEEKYHLLKIKENISSYLKSMAKDKNMEVSLSMISFEDKWICLVHPPSEVHHFEARNVPNPTLDSNE